MPIHPSVLFWNPKSIAEKTSGPKYKNRHDLEARMLRTTPNEATKIMSSLTPRTKIRQKQYIEWNTQNIQIMESNKLTLESIDKESRSSVHCWPSCFRERNRGENNGCFLSAVDGWEVLEKSYGLQLAWSLSLLSFYHFCILLEEQRWSAITMTGVMQCVLWIQFSFGRLGLCVYWIHDWSPYYLFESCNRASFRATALLSMYRPQIRNHSPLIDMGRLWCSGVRDNFHVRFHDDLWRGRWYHWNENQVLRTFTSYKDSHREESPA